MTYLVLLKCLIFYTYCVNYFRQNGKIPVIGALKKKLLEHFTAMFGISNNKNKEK